MSPERMVLVVSPEVHETGFGYCVSGHGQLPKDRALLQKHLLIREHISHCL